MSTNPAITLYRRIPRELFRINDGWRVELRRLRPRPNVSTSSYDIVTSREKGQPWRLSKVYPRALDPETYQPPNGAALRPNTAYLQTYVNKLFKAEQSLIYAIEPGTPLPDELVLVHEGENDDKYSLQPAREMTIEELNNSITEFLRNNAAMMTKEQWRQAYPKATHPRPASHPLPKNYTPKPAQRLPLKFVP